MKQITFYVDENDDEQNDIFTQLIEFIDERFIIEQIDENDEFSYTIKSY